jgi:hypothetical protein
MQLWMRFAWLPVIALSMSASTLNLNTGAASWMVSHNNAPATAAATLGGTLPLITNLGPGFWTGAVGEWIGQTTTDGNYAGGACANPGAGVACHGAVPGVFVYTLTFTSAYGGTFNILGFTGDNGVKGGSPLNTSLTVTLNNTTIFSGSSSAHNAMATCVPGAGTGGNPSCLVVADNTMNNGSGIIGFGAGTVTISAILVNDEMPGAPVGTRSPSGFILRGSADLFDSPEPSSYAMLGIGGAAIAIARLRRR